LARRWISTPDKAREIGQFFLAFCACSSKAAAVTFEINASVSSSILWIDHPTSRSSKWPFAVCTDAFDSESLIGQLKRLLFLRDRGCLAQANGTAIAQPASGSETTEIAESYGGVHPHLGSTSSARDQPAQSFAEPLSAK